MSEELHDLAAPFVLDALDELDQARFSRHLEQCDSCRIEVERLQATLLSMASLTVETPPATLKQQVLEAIGTTPQVEMPVPRRRIAWYTFAAAAVVVVLAAVGWSLFSPGRLIAAILDDPAAVTTLAASTDAGAGVFDTARLVYSEEHEAAVVVFEGLDLPADDHTYELWVIEDEVAKPAGLFRPDAEGSATVRVEGEIRPGLVVALTEEPAGGVEVPTGEPLLTAGVGP